MLFKNMGKNKTRSVKAISGQQKGSRMRKKILLAEHNLKQMSQSSLKKSHSVTPAINV